MKKAGQAICVLAVVVLAALAGQARAAGAEDAVQEVVRKYAQAQAAFDVENLKVTTADSFVEVSPAGEVDAREKMLGFYAAPKGPKPELQVDEQSTRLFGDTAVSLARLNFKMALPDGQSRGFAMRASYVAQKTGGVWKLVSAQYTAIRGK